MNRWLTGYCRTWRGNSLTESGPMEQRNNENMQDRGPQGQGLDITVVFWNIKHDMCEEIFFMAGEFVSCEFGECERNSLSQLDSYHMPCR